MTISLMKRGPTETPTLALGSREQKKTDRRLQVDSKPSRGWSEPPSKQGPLLSLSSVNTPARPLSRLLLPYNLSTHLPPPHSPALDSFLKTRLREETADLGSPASEQVREDSDTSQEPPRPKILRKFLFWSVWCWKGKADTVTCHPPCSVSAGQHLP